MATAITSAERPDWLPEHLFPFDSRFVGVDGHHIHYVDEGSGQVILFLHGNPTWSFLYRHIIARLSDQFRCVALDFPGFGLSTARDGYGFRPQDHAHVLGEFLDMLELDEMLVMLHDWSGPIGLSVAVQRPERFVGFIVGNTFAWPLDEKWRFRAMARAVGGRWGASVERQFNTFVNLAMPLATTKHLPHEVMRCYRKPFPSAESRRPIHVFAHELLASHGFLYEVQKNLGKLREHPALLVWGQRDVAFRASERARFEEVFPGHELVLLEDANHFIQEDSPDAIAEAIDEWEDLACSHLR
ncbi:alpha/beta fold hydrolase [Persicimonas caeni]|uniref:Alpha/beta fold hydrolase n=1 Tax=Persicimonas caeni TaxID=2292766 RepID=A0A4Y6PZV9_PERCE|nr:alpha/beta fold hydrolase [Persicimonas caeni]QDG53812.1 alpha/beta fold hydrolase [Persicimonas caeni]QED35033.1 alpha/beta fold hydrolase [Persicimonas caeni]